MQGTSIHQILNRDLDRLKKEIQQFPSDASLWIEREGITNSAGNLALHLTGNLQHFIGHVLGDTAYLRDRDAEFNTSFTSRAELDAQIEETKVALQKAFNQLKESDLEANYPIELFGYPMTTGFFLVHLIGHFNYHLGQINYFRRLA